MRVAGTILLAFLLGQSASTQPQDDISVLKSPPASWTVEGNAFPTKKGERPLKLADRIVAREPGELELSCTIKGEEIILVYSCRSQTCRASVCDTIGEGMEVRRAGLLRGLRDWLSARATREPSLPVIAAARAGGGPSDAVLLQDARGIHWGPALNRVLEGRSCFRLSPLPEKPNATITFAIDWDRAVDPAGVVRVPDVAAGLYALEKGTAATTGNCGRDPDAAAAWVLIVSAADFARLNGEWGEQRKSIAALEQEGLSPAATMNIRHAALAYLARPFPSK
jgi:hypothetical protein